MLEEREIGSLHTEFEVIRKREIAGVPYVFRSFNLDDEEALTKNLNNLRRTHDEIYFNNLVIKETLKRSLMYFNDKEVTSEQVDNFSPSKASVIFEEFNQLADDIINYLDGYDTPEFTVDELEEFIITDELHRQNKYNIGEKLPELSFSYRVMGINEYVEASDAISKVLDEENGPQVNKMYLDVLKDVEFGKKMITKVNGKILTDIKNLNLQLVRYINDQARKLQEQLTKLLKNPKEVGEKLKN